MANPKERYTSVTICSIGIGKVAGPSFTSSCLERHTHLRAHRLFGTPSESDLSCHWGVAMDTGRQVLQRRYWQLLVVCAVIVLAAIVVTSFVTRHRQPKVVDRSQRARTLAYVLERLSDYKDSSGHYPRSTHRDLFGRPLSSWRLVVRCFVEQVSQVPEEWVDAPWYVPENLRLLHASYSQYYVVEPPDGGLAKVNIAAIVGPGTAFGDETTTRTSIPDDTIVLVETAELDNLWTQPGDLDVRGISPTMIEGVDGQGVHVGFADGEVWYLDSGVPFDILRRYFTVEGAASQDRERDLLPYRRG